MNSEHQNSYHHDLEKTINNGRHLQKNRNLMLWYEQLYQEIFRPIPNIGQKKVLEIGSGNSPLKTLLPNIITSDVLALEHLDLIFDCHNIADFSEISDKSIDVITLTNVLHHLKDPIHFLSQATSKLKNCGEIFIVEPYFSVLSYPLYKFLHHEPVNFSISRPVLDVVDGPLSSSNQAIPYMIFFTRQSWLGELSDCYEVDKMRIGFYTSLAYMITGGISRNFRVPYSLYRIYLTFDRFLARILPKIFASFFYVRLVVKK